MLLSLTEVDHARPRCKHWHTSVLFNHAPTHTLCSSSAHRASVQGLCGPLGAPGAGAATPPAPSGAVPEMR